MVKYKLKDFAKWAKKNRLEDWRLCDAIDEMNKGSVGDSLGAYVFKKRIGLNAKGKRGGARVILCFKKGDIAIFMYGFTKNELDNLEDSELLALRAFAKDLMSLSKDELA